MAAILAWLAGTRAGRWAIGAAAGLAALAVLLLKFFTAGRAVEKRKSDDATLQAAASRKDAADAARGLGPAAVRKRLRPWTRSE